MTTALDIITDALMDNGIIGASQAPNAADADFALRKLNQILQRWSNQRLMFPVLAEVSVPLTGAASYTIGPSGADVTATRPLRVTHATHIGTDNIESPVAILGREQWDAIPLKAVTGGPPESIWYDAEVTTGRVYVWPKADSGSLKLDVLSLLSSFADTSTSCTLPDGYESALTLALTCDLRPAFRLPADIDLKRRLAAAVGVLKRTNYEPVMLAGVSESERALIERGF